MGSYVGWGYDYMYIGVCVPVYITLPEGLHVYMRLQLVS